ncbi:MarR family winged helix-turn-helix transcriptional regulator [Muricoccus radiodurans]|uniref:MarR family winged helix-turn-helix transcriptional regulator n=1 Tax=Muricoccus radiodurans TaxID=2231721 RepID=UPI003CF68415
MAQPARHPRRAPGPDRDPPSLRLLPGAGVPLRLGPLSETIGFHLRLAQEASFAAFARRSGTAGLRPGRYAILVLIGENPGLSQTALGAAVGRDKSTLTPALSDLERRGLIQRDRPPWDRRSYALSLTPAGEAMRAELAAHADAHDAALDRLLGEADRPAFLATLRRLIAGLDAAGLDAAGLESEET